MSYKLLIAVSLFSSIAVCQCKPAQLLVNVADAKSASVGNLAAEDLELNINGQAEPFNLTHLPNPPRIVMLLDRSGSMQGVLPVENYAALNFLLLVPPKSEVAVATFGNDFHLVSDFTADHQSQFNSLRDFFFNESQPKGKTAQNEAVSRSLSLFSHPSPGDSIVIFGDGVDTSRESWDALAKRLQVTQVRVFVHLMSTVRNPTPEEASGLEQTNRLSSTSGGTSFQNDLPEDPRKSEALIGGISRQLVQRIVNPFLLTLTNSASSTELQKVKIQLDQKRDRRFKQYRLEYQQRLSLCSAN